MWSLSEVISIAVISRLSSLGSCLDCLSWCHSVDYSVDCSVDYSVDYLVRSVVICDLLRDQFGSHVVVVRYHNLNFFGCHIALVRHGSGSFDLSSLSCIYRSTGCPSYARWTSRLRLRGAFAGSPLGACWFISWCVCHHLPPCTYRRSLSPLADSCPGALAAASVLNCWMYLMVLRSCTSGTVIVCGRGCLRFLYGDPPLLKVVAPPATTLV